jgi:2-phosphosulfolactate phosphatase
MKIKIAEFVEGAREASGIVVIIDVFRAFSTACYAYDSGASRVIATSEPEEAFRMGKLYRKVVLAGERNEKKIPGFDLGNSPTEFIRQDLSGTTVILTTTAGTNGLVNATKAGMVLGCSLVNAEATARYIKSHDPSNVSLVAMGYRATISADEDLLCAELVKAWLQDKNPDYSERLNRLREGSGSRFFDPANLDFSPPTDYFLCTMVNRFDFVLKGEKRPDGNIDLIKIGL